MTERDLFLAHSLQVAADSIPMHAMPGRLGEGADPVVVVGVVGIGHVPGILSNWGKVTKDDVRWDASSVEDPDPQDPHGFEPSGSISQSHGSGDPDPASKCHTLVVSVLRIRIRYSFF